MVRGWCTAIVLSFLSFAVVRGWWSAIVLSCWWSILHEFFRRTLSRSFREKNTSTNSWERNHRIAWAGQSRRTCHGSAPRPTKRKSQLQYDNFRKEQNHRICAFIRMLHGAELLSYTCNVMRQSSAVYKKLPGTFAQTLSWHPWDQNDQQRKIHQNSNTRPFDHIYPSIWLSSMVPRQKSSIAQTSFVIHIKIDQYHSLRSVPRATSQSHESKNKQILQPLSKSESKNKQILQPLSKSYPSIYMT